MVNGQGQRDLTSIWFSGIRHLSGAVGEIHDIRDVLVSEFDDQRSSSVREVQKMYDYSPPDLRNQKSHTLVDGIIGKPVLFFNFPIREDAVISKSLWANISICSLIKLFHFTLGTGKLSTWK